MAYVNQILRSKGSNTWTVTPETAVFDALALMAEKEIGAVLVMETDRLYGIFSERDYARKVALKGRSSRETSVGEIMTHEVFYVRPNNDMEECMVLMSEKHIRHLPVLSDDGKLVGIISIGDVVKAIIADHELLINHLEGYITGQV